MSSLRDGLHGSTPRAAGYGRAGPHQHARRNRRTGNGVREIRSSIGLSWKKEPDLMTGQSGGSRHLRPRLSHALIHMLRELGEVLDEQVDELGRRAVIVGLVGPCRT